MAEPSFHVSSLPIPTTFILAQAPPAISRFIYHREALQQTPGQEIHEDSSPADQPAEPPQEASATPEDTPWLPPDTSAKYIQVQTRSWGAIHMAWTSATTPKLPYRLWPLARQRKHTGSGGRLPGPLQAPRLRVC